MAIVSIELLESDIFRFDAGSLWWTNFAVQPSLGTTLSSDSMERYIVILRFYRSPDQSGWVELNLSDDPDGPGIPFPHDLSTVFESQGTFQMVARDGTSVTWGLYGADISETYFWLPSNGAEIVAFVNNLAGLTDKAVTLILNDHTNEPPVVTASANPSIINGNNAIQLTGTATDPDTTPDTLALQWTASPNIGTFSDDTALSPTWTAPAPTTSDRPVSLTLTATEPDAGLTDQASVSVTIRANQRPVATHVADQTTVDVGDTVTLTGTATDPEGESMTYNRTSDIGGAFTNPTALVATWVAPAVTESTVASLTFTANDGARTGTAVATVIVRAAATQPLTLPVVAAKSSVSGVVVNETLPEAADGLTPYIYSATGLPGGLGFRNRRVQGIPVLPGAYTVSYVVTDSNQDIVERTFTWTITGDIIPQPTGLNVRVDWGNQFYASTHSNVTSRITSGITCERGAQHRLGHPRALASRADVV